MIQGKRCNLLGVGHTAKGRLHDFVKHGLYPSSLVLKSSFALGLFSRLTIILPILTLYTIVTVYDVHEGTLLPAHMIAFDSQLLD